MKKQLLWSFFTDLPVKSSPSYEDGFTIVELIIVVVVIAILAAITLVSYSGITQRASAAAIQSDLQNGVQVMETYNIQNQTYPADQPTAQAAGLKASNNATQTYKYNYDSNGNDFCLTETNGSLKYGITSQNETPALNGGCP